MKHLFIFIDGVGYREPADDNPVSQDTSPYLCQLMNENAVKVDATLGINTGAPQSATGQATIFTGRNAPKFMGRHVEGFPGPSLRKFVEEDNLLLTLKKRGYKIRFADGYMSETIDELRNRRFKSVTTTAALTVPECIALKRDIYDNTAVTHDITRENFARLGYIGPIITPKIAAEHLIQIALAYDFTFYEFFLTDRAGHSGDITQAQKVLRTLDEFLQAVIPTANALNIGVSITSDHGNIENISIKGHTLNQVPLIALGEGSDAITKGAKTLEDVTPNILKLFPQKTK